MLPKVSNFYVIMSAERPGGSIIFEYFDSLPGMGDSLPADRLRKDFDPESSVDLLYKPESQAKSYVGIGCGI